MVVGMWGCRMSDIGRGKDVFAPPTRGILDPIAGPVAAGIRGSLVLVMVLVCFDSPSLLGSGLPAAPVSGGPALPGNAPSSRQRLKHTAFQVSSAVWCASGRGSGSRMTRRNPSSARGPLRRDPHLSVVGVRRCHRPPPRPPAPDRRTRPDATCTHVTRITVPPRDQPRPSLFYIQGRTHSNYSNTVQ